MKQRWQVWNDRRACLLTALTSNAFRGWALAFVVLALVAMVVDRHVAQRAGDLRIALFFSGSLSFAVGEAIARQRGKQFSANIFYFAQVMLLVLGAGSFNDVFASSPVITILWFAAIFACGIGSGFVSAKDPVATVLDPRGWISRSFAALGVAIGLVLFGAAWLSSSWRVGYAYSAGVAFAFGIPLCVISWLRQRARIAAQTGAGIQV